jgi:hypothetical protein
MITMASGSSYMVQSRKLTNAKSSALAARMKSIASIGILADLPPGTMVYRDSTDAPWQSESYTDEDPVEV